MKVPEEDRGLPTVTLTPGAPTAGAAVTRNELDLIQSLDLDTAPISMRERISLRGLHSSGGIGEVWRAYDEVLGREIALKRLKADKARSETNRARFFREARITGQLDHPGIVPVYDFSSNEDGSHCFYTMRFVQGRTLGEVIADFHEEREAEQTPLVGGAFLQLLGYFTSICNTVAFAHSRNIIHRDLKGDNVIIGEFGEVVVLDWGLAKQLVSDLADEPEPDPEPLDPLHVGSTMQGEQLGTPCTMAPEQALGHIERIDRRTDVYGLAALLYEILTGVPPFPGREIAEVLRAVIHDPPLPPRERVREVPVELEHICLQGLHKDPDARQPSVAVLAGQVQAWLDHFAARKRTEQERERFFDLSLDLLALVDAADRFTQTNAAWEATLGWTDETRRNAPLLEFVVAEDRPIAAGALARLREGQPQVGFEVRVESAKGAPCWVHWNARSVPGETLLYLVGRDITERKQAEQEFRGLLESAPDAMIVTDRFGRIQLANRRVEVVFGYPRSSLVGAPIDTLIPERLRGGHAEHMRRYASDPQFRMMGQGRRLTALHADGHEFAVDISLSPVEGREGPLVCIALRPRD